MSKQASCSRLISIRAMCFMWKIDHVTLPNDCFYHNGNEYLSQWYSAPTPLIHTYTIRHTCLYPTQISLTCTPSLHWYHRVCYYHFKLLCCIIFLDQKYARGRSCWSSPLCLGFHQGQYTRSVRLVLNLLGRVSKLLWNGVVLDGFICRCRKIPVSKPGCLNAYFFIQHIKYAQSNAP